MQSFRSLSAKRSNVGDLFISRSTDPYYNLALEDWLFRNIDPERCLLYVYKNSPCVVIGRNQNPWTEINHAVLRARGIPWIRRRSGGGAVYHDLGNTNFSIHTSRLGFNRAKSGSVPVQALNSLGIPARLNERNDVVVDKFKVSGSAYKIVNKRAFHHGTMLLDSDLGSLQGALRPRSQSIVTKGVASVRSPVINLKRVAPNGITHESFTLALEEAFKGTYELTDVVKHENNSLQGDSSGNVLLPEAVALEREANTLGTWDWKYGQTPEFTQVLERSFAWGFATATLHCKGGEILSCAFKTEFDGSWDDDALIGQKYGFLSERGDLHHAGSRRRKEFYEWIKSETNLL